MPRLRFELLASILRIAAWGPVTKQATAVCFLQERFFACKTITAVLLFCMCMNHMYVRLRCCHFSAAAAVISCRCGELPLPTVSWSVLFIPHTCLSGLKKNIFRPLSRPLAPPHRLIIPRRAMQTNYVRQKTKETNQPTLMKSASESDFWPGVDTPSSITLAATAFWKAGGTYIYVKYINTGGSGDDAGGNWWPSPHTTYSSRASPKYDTYIQQAGEKLTVHM